MFLKIISIVIVIITVFWVKELVIAIKEEWDINIKIKNLLMLAGIAIVMVFFIYISWVNHSVVGDLSNK